MNGKQYLGKHWVWLDGDTLYCKYVGPITLAEVQEQMQLLDKEFRADTTYYIIADVSEVTGMDAAARKLSTEWFARHSIAATVNYGVGFATRAIGALVVSLLRLLHKSTMQTHFVKTEEEARAWVLEQRKLRAEASQQT